MCPIVRRFLWIERALGFQEAALLVVLSETSRRKQNDQKQCAGNVNVPVLGSTLLSDFKSVHFR
jgi:hypothetical protein